jgi:hypothetical protein
MKYVISVFYDDAEVDVKTNDVEIAILEMLKADKTGNHAHVVDGFTGEVLAIVNNPDDENYCTEEFALMTLGFLFKMEQEVAEEEEAECVDCEPEVEREIIPSIFEVMSALARQQAEEILNPEEPDPDPVMREIEECASAEDMVLKMIQAMGGLPS